VWAGVGRVDGDPDADGAVMANFAGKLGMRVLTIAVGIPVTRATKKVVTRTWIAARPHNPPREPGDPRSRWVDAMGWAALTAAGAVAAKMAARRGAEASYRALTGLEPPPPPPTKAQKKLAKAQRKAAKAQRKAAKNQRKAPAAAGVPS
jgi:hypothetical protein